MGDVAGAKALLERAEAAAPSAAPSSSPTPSGR